jgi:cell division protein FtsB
MAKACNNCGNEQKEMTKVTMSSADWQRNEQRHEKREKRHWILEIILVALLVLSNFAWIVYESSFDDYVITQEAEQDAENGTNNFVGGNVYGETEN